MRYFHFSWLTEKENWPSSRRIKCQSIFPCFSSSTGQLTDDEYIRTAFQSKHSNLLRRSYVINSSRCTQLWTIMSLPLQPSGFHRLRHHGPRSRDRSMEMEFPTRCLRRLWQSQLFQNLSWKLTYVRMKNVYRGRQVIDLTSWFFNQHLFFFFWPCNLHFPEYNAKSKLHFFSSFCRMRSYYLPLWRGSFKVWWRHNQSWASRQAALRLDKLVSSVEPQRMEGRAAETYKGNTIGRRGESGGQGDVSDWVSPPVNRYLDSQSNRWRWVK